MLLIRLILSKTFVTSLLLNFMQYLQWVLSLLNDFDAVGFFDEYVQQGNVLLHVLEDLLLKGVHPGLIPAQLISIKEFSAPVTGDHIHHIEAEVGVALLQNFLPGRLLARPIQLPEVGRLG